MILYVTIDRPNSDKPEVVEIAELALRVVTCWAGSVAETARLMDIKAPNIHALMKRWPVMRKLIGDRYWLKDQSVGDMGGKRADALALQAFWTRVMYDERHPLKDRLAASDKLAKSYGMYLQIEVQTDAPEELRKEIHRTIDERKQMIMADRYGEVLN